MQKVVLCCSLLALAAISSFGAQVTACTGVGTSDSISVATAVGNANTYLCGDKLFSNFSDSGSPLPTGTVTMTEVTASTYELTFVPTAPGLTTAFDFGFNVAVVGGGFTITGLQENMLTSAGTGLPSIPNASTASVVNTAPFANCGLSAVTAPAQDCFVGNTPGSVSEGIVLNYNPTGTAGQPAGTLLQADFVITQSPVPTGTPEPMTLSLMGAGLLGLGLLRRLKS